MEGIKTYRFAKHTSYFQLDNAQEYEKLYEELGIIGEISYDDDMSEDDEVSTDQSPRTPDIKRPNFTMKCHTPRKPRRPRRLNSESAFRAPSAGNTGLFKFCGRRSSKHFDRPSLSILSLPYEVVLHVFEFLDLTALSRCQLVCKFWNSIATCPDLWKRLNFRYRDLSVTDLQRFLHNRAVAVCLNAAIIRNDSRSGIRSVNCCAHGVGSAPVFSSAYHDSSSPMRDPFSRVYHYQVQHLDFTNADIHSTALCLILTRCNSLANLSLENLSVSPRVLGCLAACRTLVRLNLSLCRDVTVGGLADTLEALDGLVELNLGWSSVCKYPPDAIFASLPRGLTHLNVAGFRDTLADRHVADVVSRCRRLQELDVSDSNHITAHAVDMVVQGWSSCLRGINLSRCYSVTPNCYLNFLNMPFLHFLDVFGVMDDASVGALSEALPRVNVSLRPFSAVARPAPGLGLQKYYKESTIWGHYVKL